MSFFDSFVQARMRKMYPGGEIQLERSPYGNYYDVRLTIPERDLMLGRADKEETVRYLDRTLFPRRPPKRPHWSIRGRHAGR
jgi:hypothetical protein